MNRNQEFLELMDELERQVPDLQDSVRRARARRKRVFFASRSLASLAACFGLFVLLVNFSTPVAHACAKVPVLRELAAAVTFSRSLSDAVENDYVQEMNLTQTQNGITAEIAYLIVDQKQVNVFYRLHSGQYSALAADPSVLSASGEAPESCSCGSTFQDTADNELRSVTIDFFENDVPDKLRLQLNVFSNAMEDADAAPVQSGDSGAISEENTDYLAKFDFLLAFDPQFFAAAKYLPVNRVLELDGQKITVRQIEIYPTHLRVEVEEDPENTAWLKNLDFCVRTEGGMEFAPVSNGISAVGSEETPSMVSYRADSTYFYEAKHIQLVISGARWLQKDRQKLRVNLRTGETDPLPEGIAFESAQRTGNTWTVTFRGDYTEGQPMDQLFGSTYYDAQGSAYEIRSWSTTLCDPSQNGTYAYFQEQFPLQDYPYEEVWLSPAFSHTWTAENEIVLAVQ